MPEFDELQLQKVKNFFRQLKEKPFLAVVVDGDDVHVYTKGMSSEDLDLAEIIGAIEAAGGEEQ